MKSPILNNIINTFHIKNKRNLLGLGIMNSCHIKYFPYLFDLQIHLLFFDLNVFSAKVNLDIFPDELPIDHSVSLISLIFSTIFKFSDYSLISINSVIGSNPGSTTHICASGYNMTVNS